MEKTKMNRYYLRIEGVNLNNFVYDTQDLNTIRGSGLAILESVSHLEETSINGIKLKKISTGASAGLFEFEVDENAAFDADAFCKSVEEALINKNKVFKFATFVIDVLPFTDRSVNNFLIDREKIIAKNRWRQMQSPRLAILPRNEGQNVCEVDSVNPAKADKENIKSKFVYVSESVFSRREYGKSRKDDFVKKELEQFNSSLETAETKFDLTLLNDKKFARDFKLLSTNPAKPKNIQNKMAVIYLDGNNFGKTQKELGIEQLQKFDAAKTSFQRNWLARLVEKVATDSDWQSNTEKFLQMEILLWGGDEICLVVPAWKGWETVEEFFKYEFNWENKTLTHSLGVVFCHSNAPIRQIKNLASALVDLAKKKSRQQNNIAYEILESFDHISKDLEEHRKSRCPQNGLPNPKDLILDKNKISRISSELSAFKKEMPKNKLNKIVHALLTPENFQEALSIIDDVKKELNFNIANISDVLNGEPTFWIHALALWDFIEERN